MERKCARKVPAVLRRAQANKPRLLDLPLELIEMVVRCAAYDKAGLALVQAIGPKLERLVREWISDEKRKTERYWVKGLNSEWQSNILPRDLKHLLISQPTAAYRQLVDRLARVLSLVNFETSAWYVFLEPRDLTTTWHAMNTALEIQNGTHAAGRAYARAQTAHPDVFTAERQKALMQSVIYVTHYNKSIDHLAGLIDATADALTLNSLCFGLEHGYPSDLTNPYCCYPHVHGCACRYIIGIATATCVAAFYYVLVRSTNVERDEQTLSLPASVPIDALKRDLADHAEWLDLVETAHGTMDGRILLQDLNARLAPIPVAERGAAVAVLMPRYLEALHEAPAVALRRMQTRRESEPMTLQAEPPFCPPFWSPPDTPPPDPLLPDSPPNSPQCWSAHSWCDFPCR